MKKVMYSIVGLLVGLAILSVMLSNLPENKVLGVSPSLPETTNNSEYEDLPQTERTTFNLIIDEISSYITDFKLGRTNPMWYSVKQTKETNSKSDKSSDLVAGNPSKTDSQSTGSKNESSHTIKDDGVIENPTIIENPTVVVEDSNNNIVQPVGSVVGYNTALKKFAYVNIEDIVSNINEKGVLPVDSDYYNITSPFGYRKDPFSSKRVFHSGIDIAKYSIEGREVYAILPGRIKAITTTGDYGYSILLNHGDFDTLYAHLEGFADDIKIGKKVAEGDIIGYVGSTGKSTGPHLHLSFIYKNVKINSEIFMNMILGVDKEVKDVETKEGTYEKTGVLYFD